MKKTKEKFISILIIATMCFSLASCSGAGNGSETESASSTATEQETTITAISSESPQAESSANSDKNEKIVITDQRGETIEFDSVPDKIATTIMPFPSIYFAVAGSAEKLIGINPSSMIAYENSTLQYMSPEMANASTSWVDTSFIVNIEELLLMEPDVVFQWTSQPEEIAKMEEVGLKVIGLEYGDLDDLKTWINIIATLLGIEERSNELSEIFDANIAESDAILATIPETEYKNTISLSADLRVTGAGFSSYWFEHSGSINPAGGLSGDGTMVDMEQIYEWNPDIIYIGNFTDIMPEDLLENKIDGQDWSAVKAVQNGQVYKIPIGGYRWDPPCIETPLMVKWMAKVNHPEQYAEMDIRQEITDFYKDVYDFEMTEAILDEILDDASKGLY